MWRVAEATSGSNSSMRLPTHRESKYQVCPTKYKELNLRNSIFISISIVPGESSIFMSVSIFHEDLIFMTF